VDNVDDGRYFLEALSKYVDDDWSDKLGGEILGSGSWKMSFIRDPHQSNRVDCGVFTIM
jgi:Ulp1 family protease